MSKEQKDVEYKPNNKFSKGKRHTPCRTRQTHSRHVYTGSDSDSGLSGFVGENDTTVLYLHDETITHTRRYSKENMARQEKTQMESIMEMFLKMSEDDNIIEDRREQERQRREQERGLEGERIETGKRDINNCYSN